MERPGCGRTPRPTPAYRELADRLRLGIMENVYGGGRRLPTEAELASDHGVSRQTVRRAYQELVAEGIVHRTPGRGTFPAPPGQYMPAFGCLEDMLAHAGDTVLEVLDGLHQAIEPPDEACALLESDSLHCLRVRRLRGGLPFCHSVIYVPEAVARPLARLPTFRRAGSQSPTAVIAILDRLWSRPITCARQEVTIDRIGRTAAPLIDCRPGEAVLRIDHLFIDADGMPVELAINRFHPQRYVYRVELRRTQKP